LGHDVEGVKLGHLVWSPGGAKLVPTVGFNLRGLSEGQTHSIIRVDLSK
jgi:hypothetical protein